MMRRVRVDAASPEAGALRVAADVIAAGDVVAFPTDTLYGLAADPFNAEAVERVFTVKGRSGEKALPLIAADIPQAERWLTPLSGWALALAERFWPGPLTLLVCAPPTLADAVTGNTGRVAVRVPGHAVARGLCRACGRPLTATSANRSGGAPTADPDDVARTLTDVALLLDAGPTPGGAPSTIVDVAGAAPKLVRAGAIDWGEIQKWLERA